MKRLKRIGTSLLTLLLVLTVQEGCAHIFDIDLYILSASSNIIQALFTNRDILWIHSPVTLQEAVVSLLITALLTIVVAIGMDLSQPLRHSTFPHLVIAQTVPVTVLGLLFFIWPGFGAVPKILTIIFMCFFPVVIVLCDALGKADEHQISLLKSFRAGKQQIYAYAKIPAASTVLLSGLRAAATYCTGGAIVGEWLNAPAGLGYYMICVENGYMLDKTLTHVVVTVASSLLPHGAVILLETALFPYAGKKRGKAK